MSLLFSFVSFVFFVDRRGFFSRRRATDIARAMAQAALRAK